MSSTADWFRKKMNQPQQPQRQQATPPVGLPSIVNNQPLQPTQWQRPTTETPPQQLPQQTDFQAALAQAQTTEERGQVFAIANRSGALPPGEAHKHDHVHACPSCGDTTYLAGMPMDAAGAAVFNSTTGQSAYPAARCVKCGFNQKFGAHTVPNLPQG